MKIRIVYLVLFWALIFGNSNAASLNTNELEARKFVESVSEKLHTYSVDIDLINFQLENRESYELQGELDKIMGISDNIAEIVRESKKFDSSQFNDEELKYIFEIISQMSEEGILGRWRYEDIMSAINKVEGMPYRKNIAKFRNKNFKLAYIPDIEKIVSHTNDTKELRHYWKQWRQYNSDLVIRSLITVTTGLLDAANATGIPALEFWMKGLNITEMERIMNETRPLYLQLHAFIRNQLHKKYGDEVLKPDGIIPDHLFRQILAQTWTNSSIIEEMFPFEKLPAYEEIITENNYNADELFKTADRFYKSLGFNSLPDDYWGSQIKMSSKKDEADCKPSISDSTKNVYMLYCHKMDFKTFLQTHGYMGQLYYAREKNDLPSYFFSAHNLEYAVGEAAILSASTIGHLKTIGLLDNFRVTQDVEFNRFLRMGFHTLLNIPQHFVHSKVMADFAAGEVNLTHLNIHYWSLMDQYVGVGPPINRVSSGTFDFPPRFYQELNENREGRKFHTELFGYKFYKKFCEMSGKFPKEPLHKCDFFGNKDVGDSLKKMMKLGCSKRLNKVLETIFPENSSMSSDGLLEYYRPMMSWLSENNDEENVKLGWTHSDKKVGKISLYSDEDYD